MKVRQGAATYSRVNFLSRTPQPRSGATVWSCHYRCAFAKVEFNVDSRPFTKKHETPECNSPGQADEQQTTAPFHEDEAKRRVQVQPRAVRTDSSPTFHGERGETLSPTAHSNCFLWIPQLRALGARRSSLTGHSRLCGPLFGRVVMPQRLRALTTGLVSDL